MAQNYGKNIFGYDLGDPNKPDEPDFFDPSVGIDEIDQYNKEIANYMANNSIGKQPVRKGVLNPLNVQVADGTAGVPSQLDELMSPETNSDLKAGTLPIEVTKAALSDIVKDPGPKTKPSQSSPPFSFGQVAPEIQSPVVDAGDNVDIDDNDPYKILKQFMVDQESARNRRNPIETADLNPKSLIDMVMSFLNPNNVPVR
tara:strand:+ start:721 stop:1320 length:600 start_codon:yes stop_codon:yes gene_type:complete